jgi:hypothetical protein
MWHLIGDLGFTPGPLLAAAVAGALTLTFAALMMGNSGIAATLVFAFFVPETVEKT